MPWSSIPPIISQSEPPCPILRNLNSSTSESSHACNVRLNTSLCPGPSIDDSTRWLGRHAQTDTRTRTHTYEGADHAHHQRKSSVQHDMTYRLKQLQRLPQHVPEIPGHMLRLTFDWARAGRTLRAHPFNRRALPHPRAVTPLDA